MNGIASYYRSRI